MPRSAGRPAVQIPEPERLWIRYVPRPWPFPPFPWLDAAAGRLGRTGSAGLASPLGELFADGWGFDDTIYLPPVEAGRRTERAWVAAALAAAGTPVFFQVPAGEPPPEPPTGVTVAVDLLPVFLSGAAWPVAPKGGAGVLWPLLPGLSDDPASWLEGLARLAGFAWVQGIVPELSPADRRRLVELGGDAAFAALYHRDPAPDGAREREFAAAVTHAGFAPFAPRPLPAAPAASSRVIGNRRLAGVLTLAGSLWGRLDRPADQGQAFYRAARWVDATSYDVTALTREGNLAVIEALDAESRRWLAAAVQEGRSADLSALLAEYVAFPAAAGSG